MKRQAIVAALLALLAGAPVAAVLGGSKVIYAGGTVEALPRRTEGRLSTWALTNLSFTPDIRGIKPLLIRYKSITRMEYGPNPGRRGGAARPRPSLDRNRSRYLTLFYRDLDEEQKAKKEKSQPQESRKDQKSQPDEDMEKEYIAVFELGEGVLRPTLRIVETRSGKRITYQDAAARKAAR